MKFVEGKIIQEKVFGDAVFPKTLNPPIGKACGTSDLLVEMIKEKREWLTDLLKRHLAILFRGFNVLTPEEFQSVVEAFNWDEMPYLGPTHRAKVTDRVFTANQAPVGQCINFHHEMFLVSITLMSKYKTNCNINMCYICRLNNNLRRYSSIAKSQLQKVERHPYCLATLL